jgi:hypothetical protein
MITETEIRLSQAPDPWEEPEQKSPWILSLYIPAIGGMIGVAYCLVRAWGALH